MCVPFSTLILQGSKRLRLRSGQSLVLYVLANDAAVPSMRPDSVLKSSVCMPLKFPHRPSKSTCISHRHFQHFNKRKH